MPWSRREICGRIAIPHAGGKRFRKGEGEMEQENKELLEKRAEYNRLFKAQDYFYVRAASRANLSEAAFWILYRQRRTLSRSAAVFLFIATGGCGIAKGP